MWVAALSKVSHESDVLLPDTDLVEAPTAPRERSAIQLQHRRTVPATEAVQLGESRVPFFVNCPRAAG